MNDEDQTQEQTIEEVIAQRDEYLNSWKRSVADFENFKRRKTEEEKELVTFAREYAVVRLLPTLDSLHAALVHMPPASNDQQESRIKNPEFEKEYLVWKEGVLGLVKQLDDALMALGVQRIDAVGKKFDPNFHEAVREIDGEDDGTILEEYQTGYIINNKVIRPSQVAISKHVKS